MTRDEFLNWLETVLTAAGVPVRRWTVAPGLEDLEIALGGATRRLRIVRTAPTGTGRR